MIPVQFDRVMVLEFPAMVGQVGMTDPSGRRLALSSPASGEGAATVAERYFRA